MLLKPRSKRTKITKWNRIFKKCVSPKNTDALGTRQRPNTSTNCHNSFHVINHNDAPCRTQSPAVAPSRRRRPTSSTSPALPPPPIAPPPPTATAAPLCRLRAPPSSFALEIRGRAVEHQLGPTFIIVIVDPHGWQIDRADTHRGSRVEIPAAPLASTSQRCPSPSLPSQIPPSLRHEERPPPPRGRGGLRGARLPRLRPAGPGRGRPPAAAGPRPGRRAAGGAPRGPRGWRRGPPGRRGGRRHASRRRSGGTRRRRPPRSTPPRPSRLRPPRSPRSPRSPREERRRRRRRRRRSRRRRCWTGS